MTFAAAAGTLAWLVAVAMADSCTMNPTGSLFLEDVFPEQDGTDATNVTLIWSHDCAHNTTTFSLTGNVYKGIGWLGVGFLELDMLNASALMQNADLYQFSLNGATASYKNRFGATNHEPVDDPVESFVGAPMLSVTGVQLTATFTRNWAPPSSLQVTLSADPLYVLVARGNDSALTKYHYDQRFFAPQELYLFGRAPPPAPSPLPSGACATYAQGTFVVSDPFRGAPPATDVHVSWTHNCTANTTQFALVGNTTGWLGIGFVTPSLMFEPKLMTNADIYQFAANNYSNRFAFYNTEPLFDEKSAFIGNVSLSYVGTELTATFTRAWAPISAQQVPLDQGPLYVMVARSALPSLTSYHKHDRRFDRVMIDLFGPALSPTPKPSPHWTPLPQPTPVPTTQPPDHGNPCLTTSTFSNVFYGGASGELMTVAYTVDCVAKTIEFTVQGATPGWLGIGFNTQQGLMADSDLYMVAVAANGTALAYNAYCATKHSVSAQATQAMISGVAGSANAGSLAVTFKRPWAALNNATNVPLSYGAPVYLLFAKRVADADFTQEHDAGHFATANKIELFTTSPFRPDPYGAARIYLIVHGVLMFIAFAVLMPVGTFFARHLKDIGHFWFQTHRAMLSVAVLLALGAFAIAVVRVQAAHATHFDVTNSNPHKLMGLIVIILSVIQPILGFVADRLFVPNRFEVPAFPDKLHWYLGRLIIVAAFVTIYFGFSLLQSDSSPFKLPTSAIVFLVWAFLMFVYQIIGQISLGVIHHVHYGVQFSDRSHSEVQRLLDGKQTNVARARWWSKFSFFVVLPGIVVAVLAVLLGNDPLLFQGI